MNLPVDINLLRVAGCFLATLLLCCSSRPVRTIGAEGGVADSAPRVLTFYADILPILSSSKPGANYRCTVCHASYGDPRHVARPAVAQAIIESVTSRRMPLTGDPLKAVEVDALRNWFYQGAAAGAP